MCTETLSERVHTISACTVRARSLDGQLQKSTAASGKGGGSVRGAVKVHAGLPARSGKAGVFCCVCVMWCARACAGVPAV